MEPNPRGSIAPWQWIVTVIVIVAIILLIVFFTRSSTPNLPVSPASGTAPITAPVAPTTNALIVADQFPGNVAYITSAQVTKPAWVVVREILPTGKAGTVLGNTYLAEAGIFPVRVELSKSTLDKKTYLVELYEDNGDKVFNLANDTALLGANGKPATATFKASSVLSEVKG